MTLAEFGRSRPLKWTLLEGNGSMEEAPKNPLNYEAPGMARDCEPVDPTVGGTSAVQLLVGLILGVGGGTLMSYCAYRWGGRAWPAAILLLLSGKLGGGVGVL